MLSVVLYGRNDSYGYNLHKRAALSLNCIAELVTNEQDEDPVRRLQHAGRLPFPEAIKDTLTVRTRGLLRILRVGPKHDQRFRDCTHLLALEPVARNIAVRRSNPSNRWILSTNTDMIFVPRAARSLSEIAAGLQDGYSHLPRFEVPESLWELLDRMDPSVAHLHNLVQMECPAPSASEMIIVGKRASHSGNRRNGSQSRLRRLCPGHGIRSCLEARLARQAETNPYAPPA
jgi:hypothetical protein